MTKEELKEMFSRSDWNEETILEADKVISRIAEEHLGLNTYPNQFEIVTSEQGRTKNRQPFRVIFPF